MFKNPTPVSEDSDLFTALRAWEIASSLCEDSCHGYHRVRPMLRALGLGASPFDQLEFFEGTLQTAFKRGQRRVLVCGTSDTAMPQIVVRAAIASGHDVALTVLDRCATPVQLAQEAGHEGIVADLLTHKANDAFDVVVTHSLLGQFADEIRPGLFAALAGMLAPGGTFITVNRLRKNAVGTAFKPEAAEALAAEAARRYAALEIAKGPDAAGLERAINAHLAARKTVPLRDVARITELCGGAGLSVEELRVAPRQSANTLEDGGPAMPGSADYAHLVARKPA